MRLAIEESRKTSVKYRKIRPFWVLLLLPMVASLSACKAETAADEEVVRPVKVAILAPASSGRVLTYSGVVRARVESAVGFRVSGKIVERRVNIGDRLDAGQVIARLDDTDLKLAEGSAKSTLNAARTRRDVASINLERAKPLLPKGFISKAAFDIRRNEMDAASAALDNRQITTEPGHECGCLHDTAGRHGRRRHIGHGRAGPSRECWAARHYACRRRRDRDCDRRPRAGGRPSIGWPERPDQALGERLMTASTVAFVKSPVRPRRHLVRTPSGSP